MFANGHLCRKSQRMDQNELRAVIILQDTVLQPSNDKWNLKLKTLFPLAFLKMKYLGVNLTNDLYEENYKTDKKRNKSV